LDSPSRVTAGMMASQKKGSVSTDGEYRRVETLESALDQSREHKYVPGTFCHGRNALLVRLALVSRRPRMWAANNCANGADRHCEEPQKGDEERIHARLRSAAAIQRCFWLLVATLLGMTLLYDGNSLDSSEPTRKMTGGCDGRSNESLP
jgi:hypothetical protein